MVALNIETLLAWVVHRPPHSLRSRRHCPMRAKPQKQERSNKQEEEETQLQQEPNNPRQQERKPQGNGRTDVVSTPLAAYEGSPISEVVLPASAIHLPPPACLPEAQEPGNTGFEADTIAPTMVELENSELQKTRKRETTEGGEAEGSEEGEEAWARKEERRRRRQQRALEHLARATHLHLQDRAISSISDVALCRGATVIFLQHNHLSRLNLPILPKLQHLYLQHNDIVRLCRPYLSNAVSNPRRRLEGLDRQPRLLKLLASGNRIGVLEGLAPPLDHLALDHQRIPQGDALVLDPQALLAVQTTLTLLDISGNQLTEIGAVGLLTNLRVGCQMLDNR
ncbi:uncharacterized protein LOC143032041 [Oratosquilla oratoria]|uniref:uncharacterized protein LOC143032041 n=1 Tax=Oratosquilla oratoria TaxID=337810 RepID=UPI003F76997A